MLVKMYGESREQKVEKRYSPAKYVRSKKNVVFGDPDPKYISTSFVEWNNLTMRMGMRRFTPLTVGFRVFRQTRSWTVCTRSREDAKKKPKCLTGSCAGSSGRSPRSKCGW